METSRLAKSKIQPEVISINDPFLLATLWEDEEIRERLDTLAIIAEHIDLHSADMTIVAWEQLLSLIKNVDSRYALNMQSARTNVAKLGIQLPDEDEGIDALSAVLAQIDVADETGFPCAKVHPARHLVCNIGVLRACTFMKTAHSIIRSTHAIEPTSGAHKLVSRLDRHRQTLSSEVFEHQKHMLVELSDQFHEIEAIDLQMELHDFRKLGKAYWRVGP